MPVELIGFLGLLSMFLLMILRVPLSISMAIPAFIGILYLKGWVTLQTGIETIIWNHSYSYTLSAIPMFVLMGELLYTSGISNELFTTFRAWISKLKGGLGMATVASSALFAAASGSSLATTATMGVIASKEMLRSGYDKSLTGGAIIAGGTLGVLIPPSTVFIVYGMMTEQSIGHLLIAGIIPGIVLMLLYMITIYISVLINPKLAPSTDDNFTWKERFYSLKSTIWILILFVVVIGGMYLGLFTPTEAAGVGAFVALLLALIRRKLTVNTFIEALSRTLKTTGFLFAIIIMAFILNYFFTITRMPLLLANFFADLNLPPYVVFALIVLLYFLLGAVMDALAMVVVTIPIILPIIQALGFDLIWFGVVIVILIELAAMSPPIGMNVFVLDGAAPKLGLGNIFRGAFRFMIPIFVMIILLYIFPEIALFLPSNM